MTSPSATQRLAILRARRIAQHRNAFPDLRTDKPNLSPTTAGFGPTPKRQPNASPAHLIVDTLHKQGPQVLSRSELPWAGGRKP